LPRFTADGPDPADLERVLIEVAGTAGTPEEQAAVRAVIREEFRRQAF